MVNRGKVFERNFKNSVPKGVLYERFNDGTASWGSNNSNQVRFQKSSPCDCFIFDGSILMYLELKSHKGKSLPFSCIRENQIKELLERQTHMNVISGLLIEFQDLERVFYLNISDLLMFKEQTDRKSIPFEFVRDKGIEIEVQKLRTNYKYNVNKMLDDIINRDL